MNIFEFAKKMEQDGERYYRELADRNKGTVLEKILIELAEAEVTHYKALIEMEQGKNPSLDETELLATAKNIFASSAKEMTGGGPFSPEIDLYRHARDIELMSQFFYEQKAEEMSNPRHKETFLTIAGQERQHYFLMEEMIEFLLRPHTWLENAEWRHSDEY